MLQALRMTGLASQDRSQFSTGLAVCSPPDRGLKVWLRPVSAEWLRRLVVEEWLSEPIHQVQDLVMAGERSSAAEPGCSPQNRRLSLCWFEPNTCHHLVKQFLTCAYAVRNSSYEPLAVPGDSRRVAAVCETIAKQSQTVASSRNGLGHLVDQDHDERMLGRRHVVALVPASTAARACMSVTACSSMAAMARGSASYRPKVSKMTRP
jgi:hypothetical protein